MTKVVITGVRGLLGWHAHARLHARNCASVFAGEGMLYDIVALDRASFNNKAILEAALVGADVVLHFAGVNRADDSIMERANADIAQTLVDAYKISKSQAHIVYANSVHASKNTAYGNSKRIAGEILAGAVSSCADLLLPHIFGECARPDYNNVTATIIDRLHQGVVFKPDPNGEVELLHAGQAVEFAIVSAEQKARGQLRPEGRKIRVPELFGMLEAMHRRYSANLYPDLSCAFDIALFNSYRAASYPGGWPRPLKVNKDQRGRLFEAVKSIGGGQSFLSDTGPGVTRGEHFHLNKIERFLVLGGEAVIRIRKVLSHQIWEYRVSGDNPVVVDMPTLHTHSIENIGDSDLLTLFWTNELFNPDAPDTYADKVHI